VPSTSDESTTPAQPAQDGTVTFRSLGLSEALLRDLAQAKFTDPTPIQAKAIPPGLAGRDVLGCAQTGTGKTAAFVIPMIERLAGGPVGPPRGLILTPTRELAFQIQRTIGLLGRSRRVSATALVGGEDLRIQVRGLHQRPTIVVATPGRLLDHMWNGTVNLAHFTIVVLDEADRMLDMGFAPQLNQILDALSPERQTMLFSATMPDNLDGLARAGLKNPVQVMVNPPATAAHTVTHEVHHTTHDDKISLLLNLIQDPAGSVLVFTRTKHRADRLGTALEHKGHRVAVLHAGRRLSQRRAALEGFRRGTYRILVATDRGARDRRGEHRPCGQFRSAQYPGGLCPPDRADRPYEGDRARDQFRHGRRSLPASGDRETARPAGAPRCGESAASVSRDRSRPWPRSSQRSSRLWSRCTQKERRLSDGRITPPYRRPASPRVQPAGRWKPVCRCRSDKPGTTQGVPATGPDASGFHDAAPYPCDGPKPSAQATPPVIHAAEVGELNRRT
jgi:ATP-dependent RNA helicase RhlE